MRVGILRKEPGQSLPALVFGAFGALLVTWVVVFATLKTPWPMFNPDGWTEKFAAFDDAPRELPVFYGVGSGTKLWRNWSPERGAWKGEMWSVPFDPVSVIGVPVTGSMVKGSGNHAYLECTPDGRRREFSHLSTYDRWTFVLVDVRSFCNGLVRVGAVSQLGSLLGIGTPIRISSAEVFATRYLVPMTGVIFPLVFVGAIWLAGAFLAGRSGLTEPAAASVGLIATGGAALFVFSGFSISPLAGRLSAAAVLLCSFGIVAGAMFRRRLSEQTAGLVTPFSAWAIAGIALVALSAAADSGGGVWAVNVLFSPIEFSTDNQLPVRVADALSAGIAPSQITFGSWLASDRTPLLSGYLLTLYWMLRPEAFPSLHYLLELAQQASGAMIMALWAPLTWIGLRVAGVGEKIIAAVVVTLGFSGFCLFNGLYLSPKLLSGGFGLLMILALARLPHPNQQMDSADPLLAIAAVSGALALLSHGSAFFGVVAALLVCIRPMLQQGFIRLATAAMLGVLTLSPWIVWQTFLQPHGNALLRFLLVGNFGFEHRSASILAEAVQAYSALSFEKFLLMKWDAIRTLFGAPSAYCNNLQALAGSWLSAPFETLRVNETYYLSFAVAIPVLFGVLATWRSTVKLIAGSRAAVRTLALTGLVSVILWVPVAWDSTCLILYHFSFQSAFALMTAGWIVIFTRGWGARWIALLSIGLALASWVITPLAGALTIRWLWLLILVAAAGTALASLRTTLSPRQPSEQKP